MNDYSIQAYDFAEFVSGMNQYINRYEINQKDYVVGQWTRTAVFHYLIEYFEYKGIELAQIKQVYNEAGCRKFNPSNFKFIVGLSMRIFENQLKYDLDVDFLKVYERAYVVLLNKEITMNELDAITLSTS